MIRLDRDAYICVSFDGKSDSILHFACDVLQIHQIFKNNYQINRQIFETETDILPTHGSFVQETTQNGPYISVDVRSFVICLFCVCVCVCH